MIIDKYFKELETFFIRVDIQENEKTTIARFIAGWNSKIIEIVVLQHFVELQDLVEKAKKIESQLKSRKGHGFVSASNQLAWKESHERHDDRTAPKLKELVKNKSESVFFVKRRNEPSSTKQPSREKNET